MAFWTDSNFEPKQNFKWKIFFDGDRELAFYATSVTKPNFQVQTKKFKLINVEENFPTNVSWSPVKITFIDSVNNYALQKIIQTFETHNLQIENLPTEYRGMSRADSMGIERLWIQTLNNKGNPVEEWVLYNVIPSQLEMANLDYKSDDLSTYSLTLHYDWATVNQKTETSKPPEEENENEKARKKIDEQTQKYPSIPTNIGMASPFVPNATLLTIPKSQIVGEYPQYTPGPSGPFISSMQILLKDGRQITLPIKEYEHLTKQKK